MFIQSIKNYFKNLQYFFTPLGALALGIVFGLSVWYPGRGRRNTVVRPA